MSEELYLRRATEADVDILFEWVNDKAARESAFDSHVITRAEHEKWFTEILRSKDRLQFILMNEKKPIGQIRFDLDGDVAEIDYSIANEERGLGYGKELLRLAILMMKKEYPHIIKLIGRVKPSNIASYHCFNLSGFEEKYRELEYILK